jgi:predicted acetyltransferase
MDMQLIKPSIEYKDSFYQGLAECKKEGNEQSWIYLHESNMHIAQQDFNQYVETLHSYEFTPHERFVRGVTFWGVINNEVVGRLGMRLELNEDLEKFGGHIGYITRPSFREQGIATKMLELALKTEYAKKLGKILLTCDVDNEASEKTILKNGGVFQDIIELEERCNKKRFWINLAP